MNAKVLIGFLSAWMGLASAHLTDGSLAPAGGETLKAGQSFKITWGIDESHSGIDVALSTDGKTWTTIKSNLGKSTTSFSWTGSVGHDP